MLARDCLFKLQFERMNIGLWCKELSITIIINFLCCSITWGFKLGPLKFTIDALFIQKCSWIILRMTWIDFIITKSYKSYDWKFLDNIEYLEIVKWNNFSFCSIWFLIDESIIGILILIEWCLNWILINFFDS